MEAKHTPGPWFVRKQRKHAAGFLMSPPFIVAKNPKPGHGEIVASMGGGQCWYANAEANARLIAAAPELLEIVRILTERDLLDPLVSDAIRVYNKACA